MTVLKHKLIERSDGSGVIDPTAFWKRKALPNKGFDFSRRTRAIAAGHQTKTGPPTFVHSNEAADGEGIRRFQKERLENKTASFCNGNPATDIRVRNSHPEYRDKKQCSHVNESKKDDRVENHQGIPSGNTSISKGGPSPSYLPTRSETNSNLVALLALDECAIVPGARGARNKIGKKDTLYDQEVKTSIKKKPIVTTNNTSAKKNSKRNNSTEGHLVLASSKQIVLPPRKKINSFKNCGSVNDSDCSRGEPFKSNNKIRKANAKISKANKKNILFKAKHKRIGKFNRREATPFVRHKTSVAIKGTNKLDAGTKTVSKYFTDPDHRKRLGNQVLPIETQDKRTCISSSSRKDLDRATNGEEYGCNYRCDHYDKLKSAESQICAALHPISSPLLTESNLSALSRQEHVPPNEKIFCGKGLSTDDTEEELNVPETSLLRNKTETSINIMGLSPLDEFRRRAASVDEDFLAEKPKSSSVATNGSMHLCKTAIEIQQEQLLQTPDDGYTSLSSREIEKDSDSKSSLSCERDDDSHSYYSKTYRHGYSSRTPEPKQLLDEFDAVASVEAKTTTNRSLKEQNHNSPNNSRIAVGSIRDNETFVIYRNVDCNNALPKTIFDEKREEGKNFIKEKNGCSTVDHPPRYRTTILDEMIATALKPKKKRANFNKRKRKSDELARKSTRKGRDGNEYSIVRPQKRKKYLLDDGMTSTAEKAQKTKRAQINPRRISLESPPPANSRQQHEELPKLGHDQNSNCNSRSYLSNEVQQYSTSKILCYEERQFRFNCQDNDSSDWSADWDNLSVDSIPRHRYHEREDSNQSPNTAIDFIEDSSEDEDEILPHIFKPSTERVYRKEKAASKRYDEICRNKYSNPSDSSRKPFSTGHAFATIPTFLSDFENGNVSLNTPIGVKRISMITHRSISRIIFLFYIFALIGVGNDDRNCLILRNFSNSFGGTKKTKGMRPRIQFTENPNLSLIRASQMHEATTI